jgi:hypothetical protein
MSDKLLINPWFQTIFPLILFDFFKNYDSNSKTKSSFKPGFNSNSKNQTLVSVWILLIKLYQNQQFEPTKLSNCPTLV